jgi:outer membrane protein OmpA-like peptidoglycan-associated protein
VLVALAYDYDARPPEVRVVEKIVAVEPETPPTGRITGWVFREGTETPVSGATVTFEEKELSPLQTGEDGRFVSYQFETGTAVSMSIAHPDYESGRCTATIGEQGAVTEAQCTLAPLPEEAELEGRVVDQWNTPVPGARIEAKGVSTRTAVADRDGRFDVLLPKGDYVAQVEADGYLVRAHRLSIATRDALTLDVVLVDKPARGSVYTRGDEIRIRARIRFVKDSPDLEPASARIVAEMADLLLRSPEIRRIKIAGPNMGPRTNGILALNRAVTVKQRLVNAGVAAERIEAVGGDTRRLKITIEERD